MLLLPLMFGCSKESNTIVGDWYICSIEYSDSSDPELDHSCEYTKENTIGIISYTADGKGVSKSLDEEDQSVLSEMKFHWTLSKDKLTITLDRTNQSSISNIILEGDNKYYTVEQYDTGTEKIGCRECRGLLFSLLFSYTLESHYRYEEHNIP